MLFILGKTSAPRRPFFQLLHSLCRWRSASIYPHHPSSRSLSLSRYERLTTHRSQCRQRLDWTRMQIPGGRQRERRVAWRFLLFGEIPRRVREFCANVVSIPPWLLFVLIGRLV